MYSEQRHTLMGVFAVSLAHKLQKQLFFCKACGKEREMNRTLKEQAEVIRLAPPLIIPEAELDFAYERLDAVFDTSAEAGG